jgi:hypothetical protein
MQEECNEVKRPKLQEDEETELHKRREVIGDSRALSLTSSTPLGDSLMVLDIHVAWVVRTMMSRFSMSCGSS